MEPTTLVLAVWALTTLAALLAGFTLFRLPTPQPTLEIALNGVLLPATGLTDTFSGPVHFYLATRQLGLHVEDAALMTEAEWARYLDCVGKFGPVVVCRDRRAAANLIPSDWNFSAARNTL